MYRVQVEMSSRGILPAYTLQLAWEGILYPPLCGSVSAPRQQGPDDLSLCQEPLAYTQLAFLQLLGPDVQNSCFLLHSLGSQRPGL